MARELGIEQRGNELLAARGWLQVKVGYDGWPDRLVIWAPTRHFWLEWKNEHGRLTPAQENRIPLLRRGGEVVIVLESRKEAAELMEVLS